MKSRHALIVAVLLLAAPIGVAAGFALFALPFVALIALLLCGRFVGEERILAFHAARAVSRPRRSAPRRWLPVRPARVSSLFARAPRTFRGPPVFAATV